MKQQHYNDLLVGAEDWAINQVIDKVIELENENARLNEVIHAKNARRKYEEKISEDILNGTYDPIPTDFDYETDFHDKLMKFVKEHKKP